jgi:hypothetical protein
LQNAEIKGSANSRRLLQGCENFSSPISPALGAAYDIFDPDCSQLVCQLMRDPEQMDDFHSQ